MLTLSTLCSGQVSYKIFLFPGEVPKQHNFFIPTLIVAIAVIAVAMAFCIIHKRIRKYH